VMVVTPAVVDWAVVDFVSIGAPWQPGQRHSSR
jgi:hypothetical protein